jgi:uncharacterized protein (TIGR04255 family)
MIYKNNFLKMVIFRIDFDKAELGKLKDFAEKINKSFPIIEEKKGEEGIINFNFKTKELQQETSSLTTWNLYNSTKTTKIQIQPRFLTIEQSVYKESSELMSNVDIVVDFIKDFRIQTVNRLGLRYINEIKIEDKKDLLDWVLYINKGLLGSIDFSQKNKKTIARAMGMIVFKEDFGNINFNYGLWNSAYPNAISEKVFILDIDAYSKFPLDTEGIKLSEIVKEYNKGIEAVFESSIEDGLRKVLNKNK